MPRRGLPANKMELYSIACAALSFVFCAVTAMTSYGGYYAVLSYEDFVPLSSDRVGIIGSNTKDKRVLLHRCLLRCAEGPEPCNVFAVTPLGSCFLYRVSFGESSYPLFYIYYYYGSKTYELIVASNSPEEPFPGAMTWRESCRQRNNLTCDLCHHEGGQGFNCNEKLRGACYDEPALTENGTFTLWNDAISPYTWTCRGAWQFAMESVSNRTDIDETIEATCDYKGCQLLVRVYTGSDTLESVFDDFGLWTSGGSRYMSVGEPIINDAGNPHGYPKTVALADRNDYQFLNFSGNEPTFDWSSNETGNAEAIYTYYKPKN